MIFLLYGEDTYRSSQKLKELKDKFIKEVDKSGLNLTELDGEKLDMEKFNQNISASSFLANRRMIVIKNLISKNKSKNIQKEIVDYFKKQEDKKNDKENIIIFWEGGLDSSKKTFKKQAISGVLANYLLKREDIYSQEFSLFKSYDLEKWIALEVKNRKGRIEKEAIKYLASLIGNNLWQISAELDKLLAYKKDKEILTDDVGLLVKGNFDDNIFNLVDALSNKNDKLTVKLLNDQLNSGMTESYILSMLIRQFKILLQIKELSEMGKNLTSYNLASELKIHSFTAQKALGQVKNFSLEELKSIYKNLLDLDIQIKTGLNRPETALDLFISKVIA